MRRILFLFIFLGIFIGSYAQNITGTNITDGNTDFSESTILGGFISWSGDSTNFPNSDTRGGGLFFQRHYDSLASGMGSFKIVTTTAHPTTLYAKFLSAPDIWTGWYKIWHAGDDGSGSGLDADLIRGQSPQWTTNGNLIYSTNTGNVLIGKTAQANTSYKLDVNGNIRANKVVVNTTGADFVFDSSYHLRPLDEIGSYIKQYRHLPGVSSAHMMQSEGMDVGTMQTKLLQKVEELTLYLLQQQKEIDSLKRSNSQLYDRMKQITTQGRIVEDYQ